MILYLDILIGHHQFFHNENIQWMLDLFTVPSKNVDKAHTQVYVSGQTAQ